MQRALTGAFLFEKYIAEILIVKNYCARVD